MVHDDHRSPRDTHANEPMLTIISNSGGDEG